MAEISDLETNNQTRAVQTRWASGNVLMRMFKLNFRQEERQILHIDADAFFASVEQIVNPKLKGKPVLVGGPSSTKGIVSAASYEARKFGIKSAMPMYLAKQKCPEAIVLAGDFELYRDFSRRMYEVMSKFTPQVEMASIDEAYLDISGGTAMHGLDSRGVAKKILLEIYRRTGLSVSCGMASNKTVAKVASSLNKPHKMTFVPFGKEREFLAPLALRSLPGVGPKTAQLLEKFGLEKIGDISAMDLDQIWKKFGVSGIPLWKRANGLDNSPVRSAVELPKSISKEHTFYQSVSSAGACLEQLRELSRMVFAKLRKQGMKAQTIFIKIRYREDSQGAAVFRDFSFQKHLDVASSSDNQLFAEVKSLFEGNLRPGVAVRLVGVGVSGLRQNYNLNLFEREEDGLLFEQIDKIRELYGPNSLQFGV